jgi:hypothetical protein
MQSLKECIQEQTEQPTMMRIAAQPGEFGVILSTPNAMSGKRI